MPLFRWLGAVFFRGVAPAVIGSQTLEVVIAGREIPKLT